MASWEDFVAAVVHHSSPLRQPLSALPPCVQKGLERRACFSAADAARYRADMIQRVWKLAWADGPSVEPRWGLLQRLGDMIGHADKSLANDANSPDGYRLLNALPPHAGWPPHRSGAEPPSKASFAAAAQKLFNEHRKECAGDYFRLPTRHASELFKMLNEQTDRGLWRRLTLAEAESKLGEFAAWLFFAVEQPAQGGGTKLRGCLAPEGANGPEIVYLPNTVHMPGLEGYLALILKYAQALRQHKRHPTLRGWKEDYEGGFTQLRLSSLDQLLLCAFGRSPSGDICVYVPEYLMFGPRGGPHVFCRVTDKASAILAALLLVPNVAHVDDFCGVEEVLAIDSARSAVTEFHKALNLSRANPHPRQASAEGRRLFVPWEATLTFAPPCVNAHKGLCAVSICRRRKRPSIRQPLMTFWHAAAFPRCVLGNLSASGTTLLPSPWVVRDAHSPGRYASVRGTPRRATLHGCLRRHASVSESS